jgi:putative CocE/NonD family hydrolase
MRCRDGTRLASRVWTPHGQGPWPVLLMRQPYGRAIASTVTYAHPRWYASQGFQVVVQDVRGMGDSEGCFAGFVQEAADTADAVRWARNLPGSNGRVGTYGFSYQGLTQLLNDGGGGDPACLPDCLVPAMAGLCEREHWASSGGAHWWAIGLGWGLQLAALRCARQGDASGWRRLRASLESGRFLEEGAELLQALDPGGMAAGWFAADPSTEHDWRHHPVLPELLQRPMLLIGGWYDPHLEGILNLWRAARAVAGQPHLLIGAWSHLNWRGGVDQQQLAFFRRHLMTEEADGLTEACGGSIRLQCQTTHHWLSVAPERLERGEPGWGLESEGLAAVDHSEGVLKPGRGGRGELTLVHDPWRPVPGRGGHLGLDAGSCQRGDLDARCDVACFTSPALTKAEQWLGRPVVVMGVRADQPGFDLCAALSRLSPEGEVQQLCTGVLRQRGAHCLNPQEIRLTLQPLLARLEAGDRLRLSLAGAAWPQIAVNPGDGSMPLGPTGPSHRVISLTLQLSGAQLQLWPLATGDSGQLGQSGVT